ncbi:MAG: hypothetical protein JWM00_160 [Candidatus Saccharibacteria bacterium]|nr:hypothetical protein [Candidatus Saccharibacteria bacterium]
MKDVIEVIVVGSGCSASMAAQTLVEAGKQVVMVDVGYLPDPSTKQVPDKDFLSLRNTDKDQHLYLIGKDASGISWGDVGKGEQITPPRSHIFSGTENLIPIRSKTFNPIESLAYGGLGAGWGLQCWKFSDYDLRESGLDASRMNDAYEKVASRVGISATNDVAAKYTINGLQNYQPSPKLDRNHQYIQWLYDKNQRSLQKKGFILGRTPLALITKDYEGRKGYQYRDMDFYSDNDRSAWRPWMTVDKLRQGKNFTYMPGLLITKFAEKASYTEVHAIDTTSNEKKILKCKRLVLACGALGSARIALRSNNNYTTKLPLLCNSYRYVPCIQPKYVGKRAEKRKLGFTQLSLFYDPKGANEDVSVSSLYSYQSLMLFRLIRHIPLNFVDARAITQYLMSGLVIMGIHHPDRQSKDKYLQLTKDTNSLVGDHLHAHYSLSKSEKNEYRHREKAYLKAMRRMKTYGLKILDPGNGASIHYAGTLPFSDKKQQYRLSPSGRLHNTTSVYVADGSGFKYLPAKGLTFSLMANAHIVAGNVIRDEA